jgi:hypothetical protein
MTETMRPLHVDRLMISMPKHAAEVNAIHTLFRNLRSICYLFATVATGWNGHRVVLIIGIVGRE